MGGPKVFVNLTYENYKGILNSFTVIWVQICGESDKKLHRITQPELNRVKSWPPILQQWNMLGKDTRIAVFRKRSADLQQFFTGKQLDLL
ncbi:Hypothetical predicted protein [Octopus vulgaris]|uniref:Uncharacterized protein n=1 Tax=Octopus vulgaris TaxID=6645 RepID=A0AA36EXL3_OCTVU|nr:Hypothetical predicted protein [Octopus vulgaris]